MAKQQLMGFWVHGVKLDKEDIDMASLYQSEICNGFFDRERLGAFLENNGFGKNHHTFSGCSSRQQYINYVLDYLGVE